MKDDLKMGHHDQSSLPNTPDDIERRMKAGHWAVEVRRNGESVVCIESNCLSGREISADDETAIRTAAHHLLSFIGDGYPQSPAAKDDEDRASAARPRCFICGWTMAERMEDGCVPGNCSFRPRDHSQDMERVRARQATLDDAMVYLRACGWQPPRRLPNDGTWNEAIHAAADLADELDDCSGHFIANRIRELLKHPRAGGGDMTPTTATEGGG